MAGITLKTRNGTEGIEIINVSQKDRPLSRTQTLIEFSRKFNNKTDNWIKDTVKLIWDEKCRKNGRLYNQSKFRFAGLIKKDDGQVVFNLGITTYMELIGTNCHSFGKELVAYGEKHFECNNRSYLADPLGVGSLLLTSDGKFVFLKRALWTGEDKGKIDRPGGHPEPDSVSKSIETWTEEEYSKPENLLKVREEVFDSVKKEIRDEVNLPMETLEDPLLLGIVRSIERLGRPSGEFLVLCSLTANEVEALYLQSSQSEADESVGLVFLPEEDVRQQNLEPSLWHSLTDAACGAIELYSQCYSMSPNK